MSERKVLSKYYPPDFDPSALTRKRGPKQEGPKVQVVRLMAPFSMRCTSCGEYIYRGRKFNARKETPEEKYLGIQIYRFYIKCTRCSSTISFRTDPANQDYTCEKGAKRNTDPWKRGMSGKDGEEEETEEARLDRLEREHMEAEEERNAMVELEAKTADAKREMAVADALDEIRTRNARIARADAGEALLAAQAASVDEEAARQEREDKEAARRAFAFARSQAALEEVIEDEEEPAPAVAGWGGGDGLNGASSSSATSSSMSSPLPTATVTNVPVPASPKTTTSTTGDMPPPPSFKRQVKKKTDRAALLGIKKRAS